MPPAGREYTMRPGNKARDTTTASCGATIPAMRPSVPDSASCTCGSTSPTCSRRNTRPTYTASVSDSISDSPALFFRDDRRRTGGDLSGGNAFQQPPATVLQQIEHQFEPLPAFVVGIGDIGAAGMLAAEFRHAENWPRQPPREGAAGALPRSSCRPWPRSCRTGRNPPRGPAGPGGGGRTRAARPHGASEDRAGRPHGRRKFLPSRFRQGRTNHCPTPFYAVCHRPPESGRYCPGTRRARLFSVS